MLRLFKAGLLVAVLGVGSQAQAGLISAYTFDEGSGSTANDSVGSINGSLQGSASFVGGGIQGGAVSFDGTPSSLVNFGDTFAFASQSFSISVWIKTALSGAPVSKHYATIPAGYFLAVGNTGDGCPVGAHFYAGYPCSGGTANVADDQWHHLVGVYDSATTTAAIYVDGVLSSISGGGNSYIAPPANTEFIAGGINDSSGNPINAYTGLLDNLYIYDNALNADAVRSLYVSQSQNDDTGVPAPGALSLLGLGALGLIRRRTKTAA